MRGGWVCLGSSVAICSSGTWTRRLREDMFRWLGLLGAISLFGFSMTGFADLRGVIMDSSSDSKICLEACVAKVTETNLQGSPRSP
ncbi:hypothetical protein GBA52_003020 [Prunus armeniaca]|nr:hypothetical protein GBA52_003020 [Prunus armeniaca]